MTGGSATTEDKPDFIEKGRLLFAGPCTFLLSVAGLAQLPSPRAVEVAFAGRSNVGKSSLVNALTGRKTLAKTSNTPGRTRELNFFALGEHAYLVDLPGYGYAQAPKSKIKAWTDLIDAYLAGRAALRRVFLLIDARHGIKDVDRAIMDALDKAAVIYQVVLTKADKPNAADLEQVRLSVAEALRKRPAAHPDLLVTSSQSGTGLEGLRAAIAELVGDA